MTEQVTDPANAGNSANAQTDANTNSSNNAGNASQANSAQNTLSAGDPPPAPQDWPTDWREKQAASVVGKAEGEEYAKELKRLQRMNSPVDQWKSFRELEKKFANVKQTPELPKDATPEQIAEYRKAIGVPEKPEDYNTKIEGVEVTEQAKPFIDAFLKDAHENNLPQATVDATLKSYYKIAAAQQQARAEADEEAKTTSRAELQKEWGGDYKANFNAIGGILDQYPEAKEVLALARTADGTPIGYNNGFMKFMAAVSRELNPLHTIVTSGGGDKAQAVNDEIKNLEGMMGNHESEYWKGPNKDKLQARYRELVEVTKK